MAKKRKLKMVGREKGRPAKPPTRVPPRCGGISSAAVENATGRTWDDWCKILDQDKAAALPHRQIAELVHEKHGVGPWWSQMVTVGYEQARGLRQKHQKSDGFSISASRVLATAMTAAFGAVNDAGQRAEWLSEAVVVTKATPGKSVRMKWPDGSRVVVNFWNKSTARATKTQVAFQHEKIRTVAAATKLKKFWVGRLNALEKTLVG